MKIIRKMGHFSYEEKLRKLLVFNLEKSVYMPSSIQRQPEGKWR